MTARTRRLLRWGGRAPNDSANAGDHHAGGREPWPLRTIAALPKVALCIRSTLLDVSLRLRVRIPAGLEEGGLIPRSLAARAGDAVAGLFLLGASLLYHLPALVAGMIPMQDDVRIFYFPLLVATTDALRQGTLPLWSPGIFGGYPLFADGEGGMLYPLHLLTLSWLAPEASLVTS